MQIKTTTVVSLDDNEFNSLVNEHFPQTQGDYEVVAYQEIGNDTDLTCNITMGFHNKYFGSIEEEFSSKSDFRFRFDAICHELVKKGVFPDNSTIIVDASW
jgi:hypothetical protein